MKKQTLQVDNEQATMLADIGAYLRDLRQHQELSLEAVESMTLIPVRTLAAIEAGDLKRLPEPVYIQGFIKRYADAIGVDGTEFAEAFPTHATPTRVLSRPIWRSPIQAQLRPYHLYLLYTLLVISAVSGISHLLNRPNSAAARYAKTTPETLAATLNAQSLGEFYGPPTPEQVKRAAKIIAQTPTKTTVSLPQSDKPVRVSLTVKGQQSWLRIVVDGSTAFEGMLSQGAQRTWTGQEEVTVRAGDAGAVEVSFNEGQPKPLGSPGDVQEKTFGKDMQAELDSLSSPTGTDTISQAF